MRWFQLRAGTIRTRNIVGRIHAACERWLHCGSLNRECGLDSDIHEWTHIADMHLGSQIAVWMDGP